MITAINEELLKGKSVEDATYDAIIARGFTIDEIRTGVVAPGVTIDPDPATTPSGAATELSLAIRDEAVTASAASSGEPLAALATKLKDDGAAGKLSGGMIAGMIGKGVAQLLLTLLFNVDVRPVQTIGDPATNGKALNQIVTFHNTARDSSMIQYCDAVDAKGYCQGQVYVSYLCPAGKYTACIYWGKRIGSDNTYVILSSMNTQNTASAATAAAAASAAKNTVRIGTGGATPAGSATPGTATPATPAGTSTTNTAAADLFYTTIFDAGPTSVLQPNSGYTTDVKYIGQLAPDTKIVASPNTPASSKPTPSTPPGSSNANGNGAGSSPNTGGKAQPASGGASGGAPGAKSP